MEGRVTWLQEACNLCHYFRLNFEHRWIGIEYIVLGEAMTIIYDVSTTAHDSCRVCKWCWRTWTKLGVARRGLGKVFQGCSNHDGWKKLQGGKWVILLLLCQICNLCTWGVGGSERVHFQVIPIAGLQAAMWRPRSRQRRCLGCGNVMDSWMGGLKLNSIINPWTIIMLKSHVENSFLAS